MNVGLLKNMISDFWGAIFILFLLLLLVSAYIFRKKCKPSFIIGSAGQQNEQKKYLIILQKLEMS